ncbi:MAG: hypothetical protein R2698_04785 [Microthrixaceae bacterium]
MTPHRVGVVGSGRVGRETARLLVLHPGDHRIPVEFRRVDRRAAVGESPYSGSGGIRRRRERRKDLEGLDTVVLCGPQDVQMLQAGTALAAGCNVVACVDSWSVIEELRTLHDFAAEMGRTVVLSVAASVGWGVILAAHGADLVGSIDEVSVASVGVAGPECRARRVHALRTEGHEWVDGHWESSAAFSGIELVWFPPPIGAVDCTRGDLAEVRLVLDAVPLAARVVAKGAVAPTGRVGRLKRSRDAASPSVTVVTVSGCVEANECSTTYSVVGDAALSSAVLAAEAVELLSGGVEGGVRGLLDLASAERWLRAGRAAGLRLLAFDQPN